MRKIKLFCSVVREKNKYLQFCVFNSSSKLGKGIGFNSTLTNSFDLTEKLVNIKNLINFKNEMSSSKTFDSIRKVPIFPELMEELAFLSDLKGEERLFDFTDCVVQKRFKIAKGIANITRKITVHSLRPQLVAVKRMYL